MICPICHNKSSLLKEVNCGNFDQSVLYRIVKVKCCDACGHIFNQLTTDEIINLNRHYLTEYSDCHKFTEYDIEDNDTLDINQKDLKKYLIFLTEVNSNKISLTHKYKSIFLDHFIEHVVDPAKFLNDLKLFLAENGELKLTCPDSLEYLGDKLHFPEYNFLIREHIHHFDKTHLIYLLNKCGYSFTEIRYENLEIFKNVYMPSLALYFKKGFTHSIDVDNHFFDLKNKLLCTIKPLEYNFGENKNYYCYGIGKEFLYLLENNFLDKTKILGCIDNTPIKQTYTINNIKVFNDDIIKKLSPTDTIIITALAHKKIIKEKLLNNFNFKGDIL